MQALAASCEELRARTGNPPLGRVHNLPRGGAMVILRGGHHFLTLQ